tara:strand:+ start:835 stop:1338 length:504 start_codon:yes stop_codon:yes gene_type:complete
MADKQEEKQASKREDPRRSDHLEPYRWKKGQSGNLKGRPKGAVGLSKRIEERLLEEIKGGDSRQLADVLASAIVKVMLENPVKAERLISKFMDRDEGPVEKGSVVQIGIDARGVVPQAPPLVEAGSDGAPTFVDHLERLVAIAKERGLNSLPDSLVIEADKLDPDNS